MASFQILKMGGIYSEQPVKRAISGHPGEKKIIRRWRLEKFPILRSRIH